MRAVSLAIVVLLFSALFAKAQNNYIFSHGDTAAYKENVLRIYIDRVGNLYPPKPHTDSTKFPNVSRRDKDYANLRSYYEIFARDTAKLVYRETGTHFFDELQQALVSGFADSINKKLNNPKFPARKLVVLIHGFNDTATDGYHRIERRVNTRLKTEPVYLEVYWDGLKSNTERTCDVNKIWFRANKTAPYAAYTLRKLFARVKTDVDMYIISHSLGACVSSRLLFNAHDRKSFPLKEEWRKLPTPQQRRITWGVLAPAIAGRRVFKAIDETVPVGQAGNYSRIVIGYNTHDYATTKRFRPVFSRILYSTSLGCNPSAVNAVVNIVNKRCPSVEMVPFDFSGCPQNMIHHMDQYDDCPFFVKFINDIFEGR